MSRVGGKASGKKSKRPNGQRQRRADPEFHGEFDSNLSPYGRYVDREPQSGPFRRPRRSGIVGPEPDWSGKFSHFPLTFIAHLKEKCPYKKIRDLFLRRGETWDNLEHYARTRPPKGMTRQFTMWTEKDILLWTSFANAYGIRFAGDDKTYQFPRELLGFTEKTIYYAGLQPWPKPGKTEPSKAEYLIKRDAGLIRHKRTPEARLRRSLKRAMKSGALHVRPDSIFVRRYELPLSHLRERWFLNHRDTPWPEYKSSQRRILTLFPQRARLPVSGIVMEALKRCYANPVRVDETKPWFPKDPVEDLKTTLKLSFKSPTQVIRAGSAFRLDPYGSFPSTIPHIRDVGELFTELGELRPHVKAAKSVYDVRWDPIKKAYVKA